uniref:KIB1-4 beta-propeller domain-containing protein n=1 Tax=Davidia involucrata TaxID=16924 RepID=A0A5B7BKI2_DAVIN
MRNWRSFADGTIYCHRSLRKVCYGCSNIPVRFHNSCCTSGSLAGAGVGLGSIVRSSEFLRHRLREVDPPVARSLTSVSYSRDRGLGKAAPFSSVERYFSSPPRAADDQATVLGPGAASFSPSLMLRPWTSVDDKESDYHHFFIPGEQKEFRINKNLRLPWQRELLTPDDAVCVGSSHGWIAFIHPRNCFVYLFNPLMISSSDLPYIPLPPVETLPSNIRGVVVHKSDQHSAPCPSLVKQFTFDHGESGFVYTLFPQEVKEFIIHMVVLSSPPPLSPTTPSNCTVMACHSALDIAFCKPWDESWTPLQGSIGPCADIVYFSKEGRFYNLGDNKELEAWDLSDPSSPKSSVMRPSFCERELDFSELILRDHCSCVSYLVDSSGDLLLVLKYSSSESEDCLPTRRIDVYKLNFAENKWEFVECLGDRAIFLGWKYSFSVSTRDYPDLNKNSVYFTSSYGGFDKGIFNLEDNSVTPFFQRTWKDTEPPPIWLHCTSI